MNKCGESNCMIDAWTIATYVETGIVKKSLNKDQVRYFNLPEKKNWPVYESSVHIAEIAIHIQVYFNLPETGPIDQFMRMTHNSRPICCHQYNNVVQ